jgi:trimeric autotransporter adhesin
VTGLVEAYDTKHAGTGKTLAVTGYTVNDGNGGNNYSVTTVNNTTGIINPAALTITAATNSKTYDGTTVASATPTYSGLIAGDTVTGLVEAYDTKHAGTGKTLAVTGYTVNDGNGGNNYSVTTVNNVTGVINKRNITITALTNTKVYDGNTSAKAVPTSSGLLAGDAFTALLETYDNKEVGTGKTLTPIAAIYDGNNGDNYSVTYVSNHTGIITSSRTSDDIVPDNNELVKSLNTAVAKIESLESGKSQEDQDDKKDKEDDKQQGSGERKSDEKKDEGSKNYCN